MKIPNCISERLGPVRTPDSFCLRKLLFLRKIVPLASRTCHLEHGLLDSMQCPIVDADPGEVFPGVSGWFSGCSLAKCQEILGRFGRPFVLKVVGFWRQG